MIAVMVTEMSEEMVVLLLLDAVELEKASKTNRRAYQNLVA